MEDDQAEDLGPVGPGMGSDVLNVLRAANPEETSHVQMDTDTDAVIPTADTNMDTDYAVPSTGTGVETETKTATLPVVFMELPSMTLDRQQMPTGAFSALSQSQHELPVTALAETQPLPGMLPLVGGGGDNTQIQSDDLRAIKPEPHSDTAMSTMAMDTQSTATSLPSASTALEPEPLQPQQPRPTDSPLAVKLELQPSSAMPTLELHPGSGLPSFTTGTSPLGQMGPLDAHPTSSLPLMDATQQQAALASIAVITPQQPLGSVSLMDVQPPGGSGASGMLALGPMAPIAGMGSMELQPMGNMGLMEGRPESPATMGPMILPRSASLPAGTCAC